eukprot:6191823-Pleurochrysis_carterae.AAC.1
MVMVVALFVTGDGDGCCAGRLAATLERAEATCEGTWCARSLRPGVSKLCDHLFSRTATVCAEKVAWRASGVYFETLCLSHHFPLASGRFLIFFSST